MSGKEMGFIQEAFDTNWVVPLGPNVSGFEQDLEAFVGENKHVVALSAGTAAVHLSLLAYIIHSGFISGYQNRYGDNLKPPTNVYHRMTA